MLGESRWCCMVGNLRIGIPRRSHTLTHKPRLESRGPGTWRSCRKSADFGNLRQSGNQVTYARTNPEIPLTSIDYFSTSICHVSDTYVISCWKFKNLTDYQPLVLFFFSEINVSYRILKSVDISFIKWNEFLMNLKRSHLSAQHVKEDSCIFSK